MELHAFRHLWGLLGDGGPHQDLASALAAVKGAPVAYRGVEVALLAVPDRGELRELLAGHGLELIPLVLTFGASVEDHLGAYRMQLEWAAELPHRQITAHAGRDAFGESDARAFFTEALRMERDLGLTVAHETHRSRPLYAPWTAVRLLEAFPDLRLCCDFSHWVVVAERLLDDQEDAIRLAASRALHVHARVGHSQGPQVPDPDAPEWATERAAHEAWWSAVWEARARRGDAAATFTPEYGPPPYLGTAPFTRAPLADVSEVSDRAAARELARFAAHPAAKVRAEGA
ncbi:MAG: sugar phosphate isomerase/epimerase [Deltaproteobacteria bacterium]|nr:sugar phosphate isomerase/epimerase [Deltaproteobacteria bacterium]